MNVRLRPHRSQVERIRRIQDHGLGCAALLDQMSEDEEKVVHTLLDMEWRRWMSESDHTDLKLNAFAEFKITDWVAPACSTKCPKTRKKSYTSCSTRRGDDGCESPTTQISS